MSCVKCGLGNNKTNCAKNGHEKICKHCCIADNGHKCEFWAVCWNPIV
ncbi:MAG: hypothetical protein ISS36_03090 [Candidatus Aenigmarchaeota archaeon]|nr:hypothetical protein [Candidatus Aenigmarchaeota archaeon]